MSWAIKVENLSKRYRIRHNLARAATAPARWLRGERVPSEDFRALKDVSFSVKEGDVLGHHGRWLFRHLYAAGWGLS